MASSLFVGLPCQVPDDCAVNVMAWSQMDQIAALSCTSIDDQDRETNQVMFANNEGEILSKVSITHDFPAVAFDWHPVERILAIGWADGMISCWNVSLVPPFGELRPTSCYSNNTQHMDQITVLKWNPFGKRLITGDEKGMVCVWSVDSRGGLSPIRQYQQYKKKGAIATAVYCLLPLRMELMMQRVANQANGQAIASSNKRGVGGSNERGKNYSPSFFFGTERGHLVYADDLGHCTEVQQLSSAIDVMLFFEEKSRLIIITRSFLFYQYHVAEDGRVSRLSQVKLSVPNVIADRGIKSAGWAGPGLLAAATAEKIVRLFDLAADESYNLSLTSSLNRIGYSIDKSDQCTCVSFSPIDRYIAVGTANGLVAIWKFNGPPRDLGSSTSKLTSDIPATSSSDWEIIYATDLESNIMQLAWHTKGKGTLAAITDSEGTFILNESVMNSDMAGEITVIQTGSSTISLHIGLDDSLPVIIDTGMVVRSVSVGRSCFVVWSGKMAKVYRVDMHLQKYEMLPPISSAGVAMAIGDTTFLVDDTLFIAEGSIVKITNLHGIQKGAISFSVAEGNPEFVALNGKFLAVVTNYGCLKVIDVHNPSKPKQLGSAGQLFSSVSVPQHRSSSSKNKELTNGKNYNTAGATKPEVTSSGVPASTTVSHLGPDSNLMKIRTVKVNNSGTRVAILTDTIEGGSLQICHPDSKLHIYDRNKGAINQFDFAPLKRSPINVFWDEFDERLLSCEALRNRVEPKKGSMGGPVAMESTKEMSGEGIGRKASADESDKPASTSDDVEVYLFFATSEHGVLMQDSFQRKAPFGAMIALAVPKLFFRGSASGANDEFERESEKGGSLGYPGSDNGTAKLYFKVMRDFVGMDDNVADDAKSSLLNFSYNLTLGRLDEANRAVKAIDSPGIWQNMAQMCVKTKRLDVAELCLGNMGHVRGAAAVRDSRKLGDEEEVTVGVLAIQLGLYDDAAKLFREAGRFDMLNKLYQAAGLWDKAVTTAVKQDRIHLKTTHYHYAKHLESVGRVDDAIEHYQMSENSRTEVPRMLYHLGRVDELGDYVMKSKDPALLKWWAAYLESIERYDKAKKFYSEAQDYLSLVRICCFKGDLHKAAEIVQESGNRASAYHFARQLEMQDEYQEAINFYAVAGCYNHSIRLARAHGLDSELMRFAVKSTRSLMIECALYFEQKGEVDKAVQLYHKGGDIPRALDLCFVAGEQEGQENRGKKAQSQSSIMFDILNSIAQDLGEESSPQTLARCAEFLVKHKQFEKAIELFVMANRYRPAIEMCLQHKVTINDDMLTRLTPPDTVESTERKEILRDLAKTLKKQGSFTLASKKYVQAGDRVRAIKCLVRSGDTRAVIQFASISRNVEIYTLAANYLQQMNWRESMDIMKAIIMFYTKAKAFVQLAAFYDSCAQVEIDEYRDYEKAVGALKEALKYLAKDPSRQTEDMAHSIEGRIDLIERFVQARRASKKGDHEGMVEICVHLLQEPLLEDAIRSGDCLAMLVDHFHAVGKMSDAYKYLLEMEDRRIQLHPYVDAEVIDEVFRQVGHRGDHGGKDRGEEGKAGDDGGDSPVFGRGGGGVEGGEEEELEEEIEEEDEEDEMRRREAELVAAKSRPSVVNPHFKSQSRK